MVTKKHTKMKKYLFNLKHVVLGTFISLAACQDNELADIGDLVDINGPTPFYNTTDVTSSEFDCEEVELWVNYDINFLAGSNLAVNGTQYLWTVTDVDGNIVDGLELINKDLPILEQSIAAELVDVVSIEEDIADLEFDLPCETDQAKIDVINSDIVALQAELAVAEAAISEETLANVASLETQISELEPATLEDQELIFRFPAPGDYNVALTVTDNLGKFDTTERTITILQAVPTIPVPEIGEPGFEDGSLFDGTGDGRDSWRVPSNDDWSPVGGGTTVPQINSKSEEGILPDGVQAAKFPAGGARIAYQEIDVTPGATYVITYFTAFNLDAYGEMTVSIVSPEATTYAESQLEDNIIVSRTDNSDGRVVDVFKQHAITFEAGDNETVIILANNSGDESRLDAFAITVKQ